MKHYLPAIMWVSMLWVGIQAKAQYNLMPIAPPPNFSFNDLWHFNIFNSDSANTAQYYVSLRIFDGSDILKVKSNTSVISIGPGSNYYNLGNISLLQPFTTSYYDASILQQTISSGGIFPPGTYHLVYTLYGKFADGNFTPLTEDASEAVVEAMWPPMLLSPPDGDTIDTQYPLLTWTPAFSSAYVGQITYTLNLVELFPGQNAYQAIQANPLYFTQNNIPITILPYPPGAQLLDTSKTYAWQVHADAMGTSMGSSEVWTFCFCKRQDIENQTEKDTYYAILKRKPDGSIFLAKDNQLRFAYSDEYVLLPTEQVLFFIYDQDYKLLYDFQQCNDCKVTRNEKYYAINLGTGENEIDIKANKIHYLEVLNDKHERLVLMFKKTE